MNYGELGDKLIKFIKDSITRTSLKTAVLGLSGGLDSSLVAYLSKEAVGPEKVYAFSLPYGQEALEVEDAKLVAEELGINFKIIDIATIVNSYFDKSSEVSKIRRGNMMARIRMAILFDMSKLYNGLVVGTSNKSEILLGYYTVFGDGASSIAPIGDIYKTEVKKMAKYFNLPEKIVEKEPTAGLWKGQTDEEELGFTYEEADEILYYLKDEGLNEEEVEEKDIDEEIIKEVKRTMEANSFKKDLPLVPKVR